MKDYAITPNHEEEYSELGLISRSLMLLALVTAILYLRVFVAALLSPLETDGQNSVDFFSVLFLVSAVIGLLLTWRWIGLGSLIVLGSGIGLSLVTFFMPTASHWITAFFYGSPFIITGGLCVVYWHRTRVGETAEPVRET